jgi:hypothetical protein
MSYCSHYLMPGHSVRKGAVCVNPMNFSAGRITALYHGNHNRSRHPGAGFADVQEVRGGMTG